MLFSVLKWSIISLSLIFLVHHLYNFLMNTLTVPKIKDLVNKPKEQYDDIFQTMQKGTQPQVQKKTPEVKDMTDELSTFLKDLKKTGENKKNNESIVSAADQFSGNAFSAF
jgi:hypothetical protein